MVSISPVNVPPSLYWDGIDGAWSTFHVQVGTPGQVLRLLPGTSASAGDTTVSVFRTVSSMAGKSDECLQWVIRPEGCEQANPDLEGCDDSRGLLFDPKKSTSWTTERLDNGGLFKLNTYYEGFLNLTGNAYYGFETLALGLPGSDLPSLEHQVVAGIATNNYWLGSLGLSPIPFNFSTLNDSTSSRDPQPSFLNELKNHSMIPSLSWAYTAGAAYRPNPVFGSLVLGGYDTSRFVANNVTFAFAADFSRDLTVYLQSVSYDTIGSSPLLTESIPIFINSMVTHLWLPIDVCQRFEEAFNLTWSDKAQLYLVDDESHSRLSSLNPTLTFTIGHDTKEGGSVEIALPYGAFDLSGSPPFVDPPSRYFPLKRAERADQYTLGRVFLQGAYVVTDYERQSFSVSQALFPDASRMSNKTIVAIEAPGTKRTSKPSAGTIAGAVVGAVVGIILIVMSILWLIRQRKRKGHIVATEETYTDKDYRGEEELDSQEAQVHEMEHTRHKGSELDGVSTGLMELDPQMAQKVELSSGEDVSQRHELP